MAFCAIGIFAVYWYGVFHQLLAWRTSNFYRHNDHSTHSYGVDCVSNLFALLVRTNHRKGYIKWYFIIDFCVDCCRNFWSCLHDSGSISKLVGYNVVYGYHCSCVSGVIGTLSENKKRYTSRIRKTGKYARNGLIAYTTQPSRNDSNYFCYSVCYFPLLNLANSY